MRIANPLFAGSNPAALSIVPSSNGRTAGFDPAGASSNLAGAAKVLIRGQVGGKERRSIHWGSCKFFRTIMENVR